MSENINITFLPINKTVVCEKGKSIYDCAVKAGIYLNSPCGGNGVCGKCTVTLFPEGNQIKACSYKVFGNITVKLNQDISSFIPTTFIPQKNRHVDFFDETIFKKVNVVLPPPSLSDPRDDISRIEDELIALTGINNIDMPLHIIRQIPEILRENNWQLYIIYAQIQDKIFLTYAGEDISFKLMAVDLGTTTIQTSLIDGENGAILASSSVLNPQSLYGADVINRIIAAREHLPELSMVVSNIINELMKDMQEKIKDKDSIQGIFVSGNTTMLHFLYGLNPEFIRKEPYIPVAKQLSAMAGSCLGINAPVVLSAPCIASYVGGDIVSGIIDTGIYNSDKPCLLVDLGTNGEVVLACKDYTVCCSASAGPAFEGGGLKCGKRADGGAISSVDFQNGEFVLKTIDGSPPDGICASGFVSLLANLLKNKIIDKRGRFDVNSPFVTIEEESKKIVIYDDNNIFIDESDIENFMRAKSAVFGAIEFLLNSMDITAKDLDKIYIAGGISESLNIKDCLTIGLLPYIEFDKYMLYGNTSLNGSLKILGDKGLYEKAVDISRQALYFDLSSAPEFNELWSAGMFFPHTDISKFQ